MRKDYFRIAFIGFIASLIFYFISYYFEHSGVSLVIALVLLVATIYIFVLSIIRSKPTPPSPQPTSQPSPPSQTSTPQPSPPPQTVSPFQTEMIEETAKPEQSSTPPSPQSSTPICPTCGQPLVFLEDSKKWYCQNEKKIVITPSQIIEKELEAEKRELHKELDILDKHLSEGKVSKKVYRELKHKYKSRLKEIE